MSVRAAQFQVCILRPGSGNQAQPAADGVAPTQVDDVVIDLAAGDLRELEELETVHYPKLIVTGNQMAIPSLNRDLVAVGQGVRRRRGIVEMRVAEAARDADRGARIERLNGFDNGRVREPGNVGDGTVLAVADEAGQSTTLHANTHGAAGQA